jgi:glycerol-3-phosphate dehydrogenase
MKVLEKVKQTLRENKRIVRTTKGLRKERARKAMILL